jgi:alpha-tubulin suppressor-like RCC1 family protein
LATKIVTAVTAGAMFTMALTSDGLVYSCGDNDGRLGDGTTTDRSSPRQIVMTGALNGKLVTAISGPVVYGLALANDTRVYSWGSNSPGWLGDNTTTTRTSAVAVNNVFLNRKVIEISAGSAAVALTDQGKVYAWGTGNCVGVS